MFEQHPVPQQISSYQFRLIGDMTIKQFFQLAGGCLVALLIYGSPFPGILKWPLIIFSVVLGAAIAFLPLQERPLDKWLIAFLRAVYLPTLFYWKENYTVDYYASEEPVTTTAETPALNVATTAAPVGVNGNFLHNLESSEKNILGKISGLFGQGNRQPVAAAAPVVAPAPASASPVTSVNNDGVAAISGGGDTIQDIRPLVTVDTISQARPQSTPVTPNMAAQKPVVEVVRRPEINIPVRPEPVKTDLRGYAPNTTQPMQQVVVNTMAPQNQVSSVPVSQTLTPNAVSTSDVEVKAAIFSPDAAPPLPAEAPNMLTGQVMNANKKIVEGAILEIKDEQGRPVRALKTNRAGHFLIATPLPSGSYTINIEKEGLNFDPVNITTNGSLISPIAIYAK